MPDVILSEAHPGALSALDRLLDMGGPVMIILLALAIIGLITFFYLMLSGVLLAPRLTTPLENVLRQWQHQPGHRAAEQILNATRGLARYNPLPALMAYTMTACLARPDPTSLREELARRSQKALQPFEAPLKIIEVIAALAPLLGLLGTVMGMMSSFSAMSETAGQAGAAQLSGGIYVALTTTAAGLVLAIPFAALAAWTEFRLRRLNTLLNDVLVRIITIPGHEDQTAGLARPVKGPEAAEVRYQHAPVAHVTG